MIIRSKAPLRIGLAGGGTDVSPYSDLYGGVILNATISMYATATIEPIVEDTITLIAADRNEVETHQLTNELVISGVHKLSKGIYNRIVSMFGKVPSGFILTTHVDAPAGSGLGTSSTLVVAILGAFVEWMKLPLGDYDIAHLAYSIEREDLQMAGGKQDQYAATFGGFNFMEFYANDKVIVNPLRVKPQYIQELNNNLLLFYTATSRESAHIIEQQAKNVSSNNTTSIDAMHHLKEQANRMKEALLQGNLDAIGSILNFGFLHKKNMASGITNSLIEKVYAAAMHAGATGGKISGAGGGGFMTFYCPRNTRFSVIKALQSFGGEIYKYNFTEVGLTTWTIK